MGVCGSKESADAHKGSNNNEAANVAKSKPTDSNSPNVTIRTKNKNNNNSQDVPSHPSANSNVNKSSNAVDSKNSSTEDISDGLNTDMENADLSLTNSKTDATLSNEKHIPKVLLLGTGESGKSTVFTQLRIITNNKFDESERLSYRNSIHENILEIGEDLISGRRHFNITITEDEEKEYLISEKDLDFFVKESYELRCHNKMAELEQFPEHLVNILTKLSQLPSTKDLLDDYEKISQIYLMDSIRYFIENLPRIAKANYSPSDQDIIRSRSKTSGIHDAYINIGNNSKIHVFDVGGQRSERKKWIHCFNNVTVVIFCVSLSEYDQFLIEDKSQSRFHESLVLFENIVNSRWFSRTSVVLFLNKIDLFVEKLKKVPLEKYFPDYTGGQDINKAAKYILWRFFQLNRANLNIYPHITQATDTSNIKVLFSAVKETILQNNLKDSGVL
ncbi:hypothetical protein TPHA_0I02990 [Tetrapisispora phaffii CBS 4417]|uniref:Guanine nucleotide-binding protein alpha-2 subunit n=1 Tax=Tetrapisispora phaffii (strain ATCC 24235 / CBS 4417 / NBRC 1672 / NRRL Y-8282 / UCD 70-5) TaxID=1071381 RepID=G8BY22_TETPH|nr:hypothetical protein TPHA_0I02990 [Tetrapisispora phaffii CBS 4417]CCE64800.1 hypothetical protein TPHA_0I02990 [Tetrapisispora phaffii CBS 4417]